MLAGRCSKLTPEPLASRGVRLLVLVTVEALNVLAELVLQSLLCKDVRLISSVAYSQVYEKLNETRAVA